MNEFFEIFENRFKYFENDIVEFLKQGDESIDLCELAIEYNFDEQSEQKEIAELRKIINRIEFVQQRASRISNLKKILKNPKDY